MRKLFSRPDTYLIFGLLLVVGLCYFSPSYRESLDQHIVLTGQKVTLGNGAIVIENKVNIAGSGKFLVQQKLRRKANGDIEKIELMFLSEPSQVIRFDAQFDFNEFNFQPELTNANLSINESNKVSIATSESAKTPHSVKLILTKRN